MLGVERFAVLQDVGAGLAEVVGQQQLGAWGHHRAVMPRGVVGMGVRDYAGILAAAGVQPKLHLRQINSPVKPNFHALPFPNATWGQYIKREVPVDLPCL